MPEAAPPVAHGFFLSNANASFSVSSLDSTQYWVGLLVASQTQDILRATNFNRGLVTTHLYVATVVTTGWELDPAEGDGALQGHLDSRLLHPILSIGPRGARDGAATEVPLY